jgi:periplasmic divalent cation tolerance protein
VRNVTAAEDLFVVLVTAPDLQVARHLARAALEQRLAACANILPGVESHYWWQGKIDSSNEVLCIFKTTRDRQDAFEQFILKNHPYDTPEIVALPIVAGTERYLAWLRTETNG